VISKPPLSSMSPFLNFVHEEVHARDAAVRENGQTADDDSHADGRIGAEGNSDTDQEREPSRDESN
jgi:hypothetical protein